MAGILAASVFAPSLQYGRADYPKFLQRIFEMLYVHVGPAIVESPETARVIDDAKLLLALAEHAAIKIMSPGERPDAVSW